MYLVVLGILSIILTLNQPMYRWVTDTGAVALAVAVATLGPAVLGLWVTRRTLALLDARPAEPSHGQLAYNRGVAIIQTALALGHGGVLLATDWMTLCYDVPYVGRWPVVPGLLALGPFLVSVLLVWIVLYPADRAVRQIALEMYLFRGRPPRPVWRLGEYLLYSLRHQVLFILVPMLLILAASDVITKYVEPLTRYTGQRYAADLLIGLCALLVALVAPEILRHIWVTQRLPDGPLRDRLEALCVRLRLRCRDILVWRSGGMVVNAAVMGVVAPLRYVLITDAMLEQMDDTKIEAVFGHEAGHVKHHHIPCFLLFAAISGCLVTIFSVQTRTLYRTDHGLYQILLTLLGMVLLVKWGVLFGWISRRFERQADTHGVRTLSLAGLPCALPCALHSGPLVGSSAGTSPRRQDAPLCSTAAHVFSEALHEVALLNGIQAEARSWRHSSIASRSRFVQALALNPAQHRTFQRRVRYIQIAILAAAAAAGLWAAAELQLADTLAQVLRRLSS